MEGKGGALAPPLQGPLIIPLPRIPRSPEASGLRGIRDKNEVERPAFGGAKAPPFQCLGQPPRVGEKSAEHPPDDAFCT
jgi:hypothetical protein